MMCTCATCGNTMDLSKGAGIRFNCSMCAIAAHKGFGEIVDENRPQLPDLRSMKTRVTEMFEQYRSMSRGRVKTDLYNAIELEIHRYETTAMKIRYARRVR